VQKIHGRNFAMRRGVQEFFDDQPTDPEVPTWDGTGESVAWKSTAVLRLPTRLALRRKSWS